ncbi:MFS transporter [Lyticum sinuosum]|uniref:MFS transporter n=1 Tax=Lyticum sinuosum TaxID=1332059 RepID=A0AAE4VLN9_9RICK|nr:MFS transporter [Lyticum sinuosum]MDZ5761557.1 MFS transporter [Lyticum sinuosum]
MSDSYDEQGSYSKLTRNQKETIGILSIGTFLEYFDFMLYIHMAYILNGIFFPTADPHTARINEAIGIAMAVIFRPIGSLIFGYVGDNIGRKATVVITTGMMAVSCFVMASLPTYSDIGIMSTYALSACRILQGMSSMGEVIGAEIYITESTKPPVRYSAVTIVDLFAALGGFAALGIASLVLSNKMSWRYAFLIGGCIAFVGFIARTRLRESTDFINAKKRVTGKVPEKIKIGLFKRINIWQDNLNYKTLLHLLLLEFALPVTFNFSYIYCAQVLRDKFGLSQEEIIRQNFFVSIIEAFSWVVLVVLSYKFFPLKILKVKLVLFVILVFISPFILDAATSPIHILLLQFAMVGLLFSSAGAYPIFYKHLPIFKRFTAITFIFSFSRAVIFGGLPMLFIFVDNLGSWGPTWCVMFPVAIGFAYSVKYFEHINNIDPKLPDGGFWGTNVDTNEENQDQYNSVDFINSNP